MDTDPDPESGSTDQIESGSGYETVNNARNLLYCISQQKIRGKAHPILGIHIVQIPGTVGKHLVHHHLPAALPGHGKLSAIPPSNNWQAICNTAQQQLASYLQYRPATIGNLAATPEIQLVSVPDPSHFFWCGSSDPNLVITDPDADPHPRFFVLG
jgi:hypothetical protein